MSNVSRNGGPMRVRDHFAFPAALDRVGFQ